MHDSDIRLHLMSMRDAEAVTLIQVSTGPADPGRTLTALVDVLHYDETPRFVTKRPESLIGWCGTGLEMVTASPARKRWSMGDSFPLRWWSPWRSAGSVRVTMLQTTPIE